jgi:NADP-dependent 3-hydroxy acid dehydrogenase YdfG
MAVQGIADAMRLELLPHHVKVSAIHPGMVADTEFSTVRLHGDSERASTVYNGFSALTAADVAEVLYFMATCPPHVNLSDVVLTPAAQADSRLTYRQ